MSSLFGYIIFKITVSEDYITKNVYDENISVLFSLAVY